METQPDRPKTERFVAFVEQMRLAPLAQDFSEAYTLLAEILNDVGNTMTSIPYNPDNWQSDGRMYPPQMDNTREVSGHPFVRRLRILQHNTYIAENGAIEIEELHTQQVVLAKPGVDGRTVWEL